MQFHEIDFSKFKQDQLQKQTNYTPNVPLLRKAMAWLESQPDNGGVGEQSNELTWMQGLYQRFWITEENDEINVCGSSCCVAGAVAIMMGTPVAHKGGLKSLMAGEQGGSKRVYTTDYVVDDSGELWQVWEFAADQLGLTTGERGAMFEGTNSKARIRQVARQVAARAGEEL